MRPAKLILTLRLSGVLAVWLHGATVWGQAVQPAFSPDPAHLSGATDSFAPMFSRDGRHLVFLSTANNLVANDGNDPWLDLFVQDIASGSHVLVSVDRSGMGGGNGNSVSPSLSTDGRWVSWASDADNLVSGDVNQGRDIFLRDLENGVTLCVSTAWDGTPARGVGPGENRALSNHPFLSADGRWLAFESRATNLTREADLNLAADIFLWDRLEGTNRWITIGLDGRSASADCSLAGLSDDGQVLLIVSSATNLVADPVPGTPQAFLHDAATGEFFWASRQAAVASTGSVEVVSARLSGDGRVAAFQVRQAGTAETALWRYEWETTASRMVAESVSQTHELDISADGGRVVYAADGQVWVWEEALSQSALVSVGLDGSSPGNDDSHAPAISRDGSVVTFLSRATNLVTAETFGLFQAFHRDLGAGETRLASVSMNGRAGRESMESHPPTVSHDGAMVAFESLDGSMVPGDFNRAWDVLLRDVANERTRLVSRRDAASPVSTATDVLAIDRRSLSRDGRRLGYVSQAQSSFLLKTNWATDLRLLDLEDGSELQVPGARDSIDQDRRLFGPHFSADGRYMVYQETVVVPMGDVSFEFLFRSLWRDLEGGGVREVHGPLNRSSDLSLNWTSISSDGRLVVYWDKPSGSIGEGQLYLRNMQDTNQPPVLVSANVSGQPSSSRYADEAMARFSPNDEWVVFRSRDSQLTTNAVPQTRQWYARHLSRQSTRLLSYDTNGAGLPLTAEAAVLSEDSRYVVMELYGGSSRREVYRHDLGSDPPGVNDLVCTNCRQADITMDGAEVVYATRASRSVQGQIYVREIASGATELVSVVMDASEPGNGTSSQPRISQDGRYVLFASYANNLAPGDDNHTSDIFLRDRATQTTWLLSRSLDGGSGNRRSLDPVLSPDGRLAVFRSYADDLVPGDDNLRPDVFLVRLGGSDTDLDGMDDEWELAFFDTLDRDGTGDLDGDGHTDAEEFAAGTDPTDSGSILRVLTLMRGGASEVALLWSSVPGKRYQLESKESLDQPGWNPVGPIVIATETTTSGVDPEGQSEPHRFYRVRLAQ